MRCRAMPPAIFSPALLFLYFSGTFCAQAQDKALHADSSYRHQKFRRAAGKLMLAELAPFAFDRYITQEDYARISLQSVGHNLNPAHWAWDYDGFQTNQIGHPFHGSLFFNAFRSSGYSFWQSVPATFAGSYLWETFAENQAPSPNDFINTGFGGIVLGEMTHRLSDKLVNNQSRGAKRQISEIFALLINPMNGFSRIMSGQWGKRPMGITSQDTTRISIEFDMGMRKYNVNDANPFRDGRFGMYGRIRLLYGNPAEDFKKPFDNISILTEFGQDDSSKVNIVSVYGSLTGWKLYLGKLRPVAVLSANYEYINNTAFFYSGQSIRMNLYLDVPLTDKVRINSSLGAGPVILAAVPDRYLFHTRNYDYGPGFSFNGSARLSLHEKIFYSINYRGGWMKTINGNRSDYFLHTLTNELGIRIYKEISVSLESGYFNLHGNYSHYKTVDRTYPYLRISLRYNPIFL